jgi:hypothetical protein
MEVILCGAITFIPFIYFAFYIFVFIYVIVGCHLCTELQCLSLMYIFKICIQRVHNH